MLSIWIGRAGSGKSRRVLSEIAARRAERDEVLLVPEHVSHEAELDLCHACGPTASRNTEVLSFRTLAGRVLSECGGLSDFTLDNGGKLLTMRLVLQELHSQLKIFDRPSRRAAFLEQLTELTDEFYDAVPTGTQPGTPKQAQDQKKRQAEYERIKSRWLKKIEKARGR